MPRVVGFHVTWIVLWVTLTMIAGVTVSALLARDQAARNEHDARAAVLQATERVADDVVAAMQTYQYGLRGARGVILTVGEDSVTFEQFLRYSKSRDLAVEFPGAEGFGFIRRVPQGEEGKFVARMRADGRPDFEFRQYIPHAGERYIIQFIEPSEPNALSVGMDVASGPIRNAAALESMQTATTTLTGPLRRVQTEDQDERGFFLMMPIYRGGVVPTNVAERKASLVGWSFAPLVINNVLTHVRYRPDQFHLALRDVTNPTNQVLFHETEHTETTPSLYTQTVERDIYSRRWRVEMSAHPAYIEQMHMLSPVTVLSAGMAITLMLSSLVATFSVGRQRSRFIAAERARMATIIDNSSDPIIGQALDGTIISWNDAAERVFGYSRAEAIGKPLTDLLVPSDRQSEDAGLLARIAGGETVASFDTIRLTRDGTPIDVAVTAGAIRGADGKVVGAAKLLRDIRLRKEEERRLIDFSANLEREVAARTAEINRINEVLANVLSAASEVAIVATDPEGKIQLFNRGAERMLGYTAAEMMGRMPAVFLVPEEIKARGAELTAEYKVPISGFRVFVHKSELEGAEKREWTYVRKDGSRLPVTLVVTTMRNAKGEITGYLGISEDITEQIRSTQALREAKVTAEAANAAKSRFLAMMSHELRTPMTGVLGMADLLLTSDLDSEQRGLVQTLTRSAHTLLDLLNDVLDFAKIEAGRVELEEIDFSVAQIIHDVQAVVAPLASERGNNLDIQIDPSIKTAYRGDAKRYRQVVMNLVGNANKFTTAGKISIRVKENEEGRVVTLVSDTGVGIAEENRDRLFEPFVQEDVSTSRKFGGTGLGLTISKTLVELMGGKIWVESKQGEGSTFGFSIALKPGDATRIEALPDQRPTSAQTMPTAGRPLRILFAEDNATVRALVVTVLGKMNHSVVAVENGALAVEKAKHERFDIILMDMQMPVMDGPLAMQHIHAAEPEGGKTPIIAMTADAIRSNQENYIKAGASVVITKPVEWRRLAIEMARLTGGMLTAAPITDPPAAPAPPSSPLLDSALMNSIAENIDLALFAEMIDDFVASMKDYTGDIVKAAAQREMTATKRAAHALRGVAGQLGATRLSEVAKTIEVAAAQGSISDAAMGQLAEVSDATANALMTWRSHLKIRAPAAAK